MPRSHGFQDRFQSSLPIHGLPDRDDLGGLAPQVRRDPEGLADGEDADRDDDDVDAVAPAAAMPKVRRGWPVT